MAAKSGQNANHKPSLTGIELMTRYSIHSIRSPSIVTSGDGVESEFHHSKWKLVYLRKRFARKNLETLFERYQQRLMHFNLKTYLVLQTLISSSILLCAVLLNTEELVRATVDIFSQGTLALVSCVLFFIFFKENLVQRHRKMHLLLTILLAFLLTAVDLILSFKNQILGSNSYVVHIPVAFYTLLVVYNLLPVASIRKAAAIGVLVSMVPLSVSISRTVTWQLQPNTVIAEGIYYLVANIIGIYSKVMNEITLRRAFLERRNCIETKLKLNYEKEQEEKLMLSILPKYIAQQVSNDIRDSFEMMKQEGNVSEGRNFSKLYVEKHCDVSILYADIVNFTPLTVTLSVEDLVKMLNELFEQFDEAAEKNSCTRIKILGDCYYCVSGISEETPNHAKNCVEMGLKMIEIIHQVRKDRSVNVDMRIGIHTGDLISGLLGIRKWQFDIWSRDVTIANHMEQAGVAGRVHISLATKNKLGDAYKFEPGNGASRDPYLADHEIITYLVKTDESKDVDNNFSSNNLNVSELPSRNPSQEIDIGEVSSLYEVMPDPLPPMDLNGPLGKHKKSEGRVPHMFTPQKYARPSLANDDVAYEERKPATKMNVTKLSGGIGKRVSLAPRRRSTLSENQRRGAVLMDSSLDSYRKMMDEADSHMTNAIDKMPLSIYSKHDSVVKGKLNFCLSFTNRDFEWPYLRQPDVLFQYYMVGALVILLAIGAIQITIFSKFWAFHFFWIVFGITVGLVVVITLLFWITGRHNNENNEATNELEDGGSPGSQISEFCVNLWTLLHNMGPRLFFFLLTTSTIACCSFLDTVIIIDTISDNSTTSKLNDPSRESIESYHQYIWNSTFSCALAMTAGFIFYRVHFLAKLTSYLVIAVLYIAALFIILPKVCQNLDCKKDIASDHISYLISILIVLHATDRVIEFINRTEYLSQCKLIEEREEANTTRLVNKMLLMNILPLHVADIYLDSNRSSGGLYHEEYTSTAVMFASIPNYTDFRAGSDDIDGENDGIRHLKLLNDIIGEFDALLFKKEFSRIEKIKLIGSTYMAACGLIPGRQESLLVEDDEESFLGHNLATMVFFASAMSDVLTRINETSSLSTDFQLRIGIDCGPIIAGVVGAQKPLYDIWGDTVNMASRMNYTGELGKIQVTEKTAMHLFNQGIQCELRGEIFVKGKGNVITYWVYPNQNLNVEEAKLSFEMKNSSLVTPSEPILKTKGPSNGIVRRRGTGSPPINWSGPSHHKLEDIRASPVIVPTLQENQTKFMVEINCDDCMSEL